MLSGKDHELSVLLGPITFGTNGRDEVCYETSSEPKSE